jgi:hypothetical protein
MSAILVRIRTASSSAIASGTDPTQFAGKGAGSSCIKMAEPPQGNQTDMKAAALAILLFTALSGTGPCQDDLAKIDQALKAKELKAEDRAQVEDMRKQAADLCAAGNEMEGLDVTAEAKAMLNIE